MESEVWPDPTQHPGAEAWLKTLKENPDPLTRMQFSDWLEERGYQNAAAGQRWAAKNNKAPRNPINKSDHISSGGWFMGGSSPTPTGHTPEQLLHGYGDAAETSKAMLPRSFFKNAGLSHSLANPDADTVSHGHRLWSTPSQAELHFLGRSNELQWHPETGDPVFDK